MLGEFKTVDPNFRRDCGHLKDQTNHEIGAIYIHTNIYIYTYKYLYIYIHIYIYIYIYMFFKYQHGILNISPLRVLWSLRYRCVEWTGES